MLWYGLFKNTPTYFSKDVKAIHKINILIKFDNLIGK